MSENLIDVYDSEMNLLGVSTIDQAHQEGLWHKASLCWIVSEDGNLWLQQRSEQKKDYPLLLDISCAGHVHVNEPPKKAAIRLLQEKMGLKVKADELSKLFTHRMIIDKDSYHNREFCPTYLLKTQYKITDLAFNPEEVKAVFEADIQDLLDLFSGEISDISVHGVQLKAAGYKGISKKITKNDFYPHSDKFYQKLFTTVQRFIDNQ